MAVKRDEPGLLVVIPLLILTVLSVLMGLFPNPLIEYINGIVSGLI